MRKIKEKTNRKHNGKQVTFRWGKRNIITTRKEFDGT